MKFNTFEIRIKPAFWFGYTVLYGAAPTALNRKSVRSALKQLWMDGVVLAECTNGPKSWVLLARDSLPNQYEDLKNLGYRFVPTNDAPVTALLNFYFTAMSGTAGALSVFKEPTRKYWESSRRKEGAVIHCLYPVFEEYGDRIAIDISATTFRQPKPDELKGLPKTLFKISREGEFTSAEYDTPSSQDYLHEPVARNRRAGIPWMVEDSGFGTTGCKADFLRWVISTLESKGVAEIEACEPPAIPIKSLIGKSGAKANLTQDHLRSHIRAAIGQRRVKIYDRRTQESEEMQWSHIYAAISKEIQAHEVHCVDMGAKDYDGTDDVCLICIDDPELFDKSQDDTKPQAIAGFPISAQCFTSNVVTKRAEEGGEAGETPYEVSKSTALVILANEVMKSEVAQGKLLMPRVWNTKKHANLAFCMRVTAGENVAYHALQIGEDSSLRFTQASSSDKLAAALKKDGLIPVFRVDGGDGKDNFYKPIDGTAEVITTPGKAIPLPSKNGMTEHFSGINVIAPWSAYYSGPSERPAKVKVEKALVIREVRSHGVDIDVSDIATFCVDPAIRLSQATVWPAPYKLLREYCALLHAGRITKAENLKVN